MMAVKSARGFTVVELLVVIGIMALIGMMAGPALSSLTGAGTIDKAVNDTGGILEAARAYAMAHHTYVRVIFSQASVSESSAPKVLVLAISPATGALDQADAASMGDPVKWPAISLPLILNNLVISNALNARSPDTSQDANPSQSDMVSSSISVTRKLGGFTPNPTFTSCVQLGPTGEAEITNGTPARYIKFACDRPLPQNGRDPFLLRISGINGDIDILRKENGIQ